MWDRLQHALLDRLGRQNGIDVSRASLDSASIAAERGGPATGPNPTDRGKPGTKCPIVTDATGIPLALKLTGANVHDSRMLEAVVDAVPPIRFAMKDVRPVHCCRQRIVISTDTLLPFT